MKHVTIGVLLGGIALILGSNIGALIYMIWANEKAEKENQLSNWLVKMRKVQAVSLGGLISICIATLIFSLIIH